MRFKAGIITFVLFFAVIITVQAQQPTSAAESADQLRLQLIEVQAKEETLKGRAQQLDEQINPHS